MTTQIFIRAEIHNQEKVVHVKVNNELRNVLLPGESCSHHVYDGQSITIEEVDANYATDTSAATGTDDNANGTAEGNNGTGADTDTNTSSDGDNAPAGAAEANATADTATASAAE